MDRKIKYRGKIGLDILILISQFFIPFFVTLNSNRLIRITESITSGCSIALSEIGLYVIFEILVFLDLVLYQILLIQSLKIIKTSLKKDFLKYSLSSEAISPNFFAEITQEIDNYVENYHTNRYDLILSIIQCIVVIIVIATISLDLCFLLLCISLIDIISIKISEKKINNKNDKFIKETENLTNTETELFSGHDTIISYSAYDYGNKRFNYSISLFEAARFQIQLFKHAISQLAFLPTLLSESLIIIFLIVFHANDGKAPILIMAFFLYSGYLMNCMQNVVSTLTSINSVKSLRWKFEKTGIAYTPSKSEGEECITLSCVPLPNNKTFSYTFECGKKYVLTGQSGSGKSTILRYITKEQALESGSLSLSGKDYKKLTRKDILSRIAYVPQSPMLFNSSLYDNLVLGREINENKLLDLVKLTGLDRICGTTIESIKNYNIEEEGKNLSGGEKQKVAFIRASLKEKPFFILDEPVRNINEESAEKILDYINKLDSGYIMVSHFVEKIPGEYIEVKI